MKTGAARAQWEKYAWWALLATVALNPLAVAKPPSADLPFLVTVFGFPQTVVLALGVGLSLTLWGVAVLVGQALPVRGKSLIALAALLGWAGVSTAAAYDPSRSLFGSSTSALSLMHISVYCALAFLVIQLVGTKERMRALTWAVVGSATVVACVALLQQLFGIDVFKLPIDDWMVGRGFSTIGNPDHLGTFLVIPLILSSFLALSENVLRNRTIALGCLAALSVSLTGTLTRGAWIAVLVGAILTAAFLWRGRPSGLTPRSALLVTGVALAGVVVALAAASQGDLASRFTSAPLQAATAEGALSTVNAASSDRINVWRAGLLAVADRPLSGTGPAAFELGWYPNAIQPSSSGGSGGLADDPHSLAIYFLATTGVPGLLAYLALLLTAIWYGARTSVRLSAAGQLSEKGMLYIAWFVATCSGQVALLVGAVSTPIVGTAFVGLAVLSRPTAKPSGHVVTSITRQLWGTAASICGVVLALTTWPNLAAEIGTAGIYRSGDPTTISDAAAKAPWNIDVQKSYYHWRVERARAGTASDAAGLSEAEKTLLSELASAGRAHPQEYYYPSVRSQILTQASQRSNNPAIAEEAVTAAEDALKVMPASIPTRVNLALTLSVLGRYAEMAEALDGYWRNEATSPYPGILYAQALGLSGEQERSEAIFSELETRFPEDSSIDAARQQIQDTQTP